MDEKEKEILLLAGKLAISAQKILNSNLENFSENIINLKESLEKYNDTIIMLSNEEYQTKEKIKLKAESYYKELKDLAAKIVNLNNVSTADFERLEFLLKIGGINENNIKSLYENCGFKSWGII